MVKKLIWEKTTETKSMEEKEAFKKALQAEKGDMEIDLDRIDKRGKESVSCYRSVLEFTQAEYNSMAEVLLFDFSENKYIIRCVFFVNGIKIGCTYCFGNEQKYTVSKKNLKAGKNDIFLLIEIAPGMNIWDNGKPADIYFPDGFVSEEKSLHAEVKINNFENIFGENPSFFVNLKSNSKMII